MKELTNRMNYITGSPVLNLQKVADEAVACTALDKVALCGQKGLCCVVAVLLQEVVQQQQLALFLHLVDGHRVDNRLDHAAV